MAMKSQRKSILKVRKSSDIVEDYLTPKRSHHTEISKRLDKIIQQTPRRAQTPVTPRTPNRPKTPREKVIEEGLRMKNVIERLDKSIKKSKAHLKKLDKGMNRAQNYFLTSVDDIDL